jgi:hypothetical protein
MVGWLTGLRGEVAAAHNSKPPKGKTNAFTGRAKLARKTIRWSLKGSRVKVRLGIAKMMVGGMK